MPTTEKTWVTTLLEEAATFDYTLFTPQGEPEKGETVIGEAPEEARRFFALSRYYGRECERIKLEAKYQELTPQEIERLAEMDDKEDILRELCWGSIKANLGRWYVSIGLRKGWQVVEVKGKQDVVVKALRSLFEPND